MIKKSIQTIPFPTQFFLTYKTVLAYASSTKKQCVIRTHPFSIRPVKDKIFAPARMHRRWVDEQSNYIHPGMSQPLEDLRIRL